MPTPSDYKIDPALTNFLSSYGSSGHVGKQALTLVPVNSQNFQYHEWTKADILRLPTSDKVQSRSKPFTWEFGKAKTAAAVERHAQRTFIDNDDIENADSVLRLEMSKTGFVANQMLSVLEKGVRDVYADAAVPSTTLSGTGQWADSAGVEGSASDPQKDVLYTACEAVRIATGGKWPNTIVMPSKAATAFKKHSKIRDLLKYTHDELIRVFGGQSPEVKMLWDCRWLVPMPTENTAVEGATATYADIWSDNVYVAYISDMPTLDSATFGSLFWWKENVRRYEQSDENGFYIEPNMYYLPKLVNANFAYAIKDTLA